MHALPLLNTLEYKKALSGAAAGTGTSTGDTLDALGARSVQFIVPIGTVTSTGTGTITVEHGDASDLSDAAAISGLTVTWTDNDSNKFAILEATKITKRYIRVKIVRATANSVLGGVVALLIFQRKQPITQGSDIVGTDFN